MFQFPFKLGQGGWSTLGRDDRRMLGAGLGRVGVTRATEISNPDAAAISAKLDAIYQVAVQARLSQVPISVLFYGGLLSTGKDPLAPPSEVGTGFINAIQVTSNGTNSIGSFVGVELVRIGYGLNPNQAYPTGAGNTVTLPSNYPTSPLTYIYPGTVSIFDFSFRTATQTGKDVVVGSELGIDSEQQQYYAYANANSNLIDDFDSVPGWTPVLVRDAYGVDILPIEDLYLNTEGRRQRTAKGESVLSPKNPLMTPSFDGGTTTLWNGHVRKVVRHPYDGKLLRFNTMAGLIDVSPNHALIKSRPIEAVVDAKEVREGDYLSMPNLFWSSKGERGEFFGDEELAWLYGFYLAEGSSGSYFSVTRRGDGYNPSITISNQNRDYLERAKGTLERYFNRSSHIRDGQGADLLQMANGFVYKHFRDLFYTSDGSKRVPRAILNAPDRIKRAFLQGYLEGDGSKMKTGEWGYTTIYQTVAMGILHLMNSLQRRSWSVHIRDDKPNAIFTVFNQGTRNKKSGKGAVKKIRSFDYSGYLYDLVVASDHTFFAGVGPIRIHNTYEHHFVHSYNPVAGTTGNGGVSLWNDFDKQYAVTSVFNQQWQRSCRCVLNNFLTVDTITLVEWDVDTTWTPNLRQLTKAVKYFQSYPTSVRDPGENPY